MSGEAGIDHGDLRLVRVVRDGSGIDSVLQVLVGTVAIWTRQAGERSEDARELVEALER